ncbi:TonB-dependent siderophore receptor [Pollutimonas nitritireducens]|uniref:TonB-dependent siderophore receptor n=1 Tax=Pollutimonas nitritireducens TaxID=2045209 RepID=A0A2N4UBB7_9BURK|nr:TonB-dependent receptor [Pollutimonas nitritireducens]PLC52316.1 TonB-dependent siderophore receptor [Pollutimonas nitritireducens]
MSYLPQFRPSLARPLTAAGLLFASGGAFAQSAAPATVLPAVTVQGSQGAVQVQPAYAGGQVARGGGLGLLGSEDVMDTPFSTVNYTAQMMEDIQARTLADVITNDASVRTTTSTGGFGEDFQIRGFSVGTGDVGLNGLYGLLSANRVPMELVERVELLKGPGTLMRGIPPTGSIGGSVNVVTKRAHDDPLTRLTTTYTSKANLGTHLDMGRRFGENNAWGVRFNGVVRGGEASNYDGEQNLGLGALALDYQGDRLRWSLDTIYQEDKVDDFRAQIGFRPDITEIPAAPDGRITFYPDTTLTQRDKTIASRLEYDLTDNLTGHVALGYRDNVVRQVFPISVNPVTLARQGVDAEGNFGVMNSFYDSYSKTLSGDVGLTARFDTGGIGHSVAVAVTRMSQETGNAYSPGSTAVASNLYDPAPLPANASLRNHMQRASETTLDSIAIADTLSFAQDRVLLTVGARRQTVAVDSYNTATGARSGTYKADAVSPVAGIVVKPLENVSIYSNFTEGLTRGTVVGATYANAGEVLNPYKSKQYEAGVKVDWGRVTTTMAIYQLARPAAQADESNVYGYFGEQRNRGVELSAYGELQPGLRIMASAAYTQGKLTTTQNGINEGNKAPGVPSHTVNLGLDWDTPWVDGLSLTGRAAYTSSSYVSADNTLSLPAVTTFDVGARYRTKVAGKAVVLRANIDNLTDKKYWLANGSFATNAAGRTVMLSASVDF